MTPTSPETTGPETTGAAGEDPGRLDPPRQAVVDAVRRALSEDLLPMGDLTAALVPPSSRRTVDLVSRAHGVVAGRACALETLRQVGPDLDVDWKIADGSRVSPGSVIATIDGSLRSILSAERTVLNFLGHLSGIATLTRQYVDAVGESSSGTRVLDTRKTLPGLRALQKAAVRAGGGVNHRGSLSDAVLIKDNHLGGVSILEAVQRARDLWPGRMVEVECDRLSQVEEALDAGASVVMLDNMTLDLIAQSVRLVRSRGTTTLVEVSGGVDLASAPVLAATGADLISVGRLTHSAPVLDVGFDLAVPGAPGSAGPDRIRSA